jgi:glycosyltransferase involved in cell wall biosynthesis
LRKKIVHIITGLNDGGAEGVLFRLCLNSTNNRHIVISLMDKGKYGPLLEDAGVSVHYLGMNPGRPSIKRFLKLVSLIRSEEPDAVQTWMYHADLLGGLAAKFAGVRKIVWGIRHSTLEKGKAKKSTIAIARLCAVLSRFVPEKIVCCADKALSVHRDVGYAARKLLVIPNGYDLSKFMVDEQSGSQVRASLGISPETFLLGKVGRYDPFKDHDNLLSALFQLQLSGVDFKCLLVGRGLTSENSELIARITELELGDKIILAGQRTDIPAVMNALDLHVLSSSSEGFPNVLAEAMACGTPAVSTEVGDAGEIVGDPALLCPPRNPKALSELMLAMHTEWLERPGDWAERRTSCVEHIKNNFSIERMVVAYEQCWFGD